MTKPLYEMLEADEREFVSDRTGSLTVEGHAFWMAARKLTHVGWTRMGDTAREFHFSYIDPRHPPGHGWIALYAEPPK